MSRRAEFGNGAHFIEKDPDGAERARSAIEAVGGDPSKYAGPLSAWDRDSIRLVEEERVRSQSDWND